MKGHQKWVSRVYTEESGGNKRDGVHPEVDKPVFMSETLIRLDRTHDDRHPERSTHWNTFNEVWRTQFTLTLTEGNPGDNPQGTAISEEGTTDCVSFTSRTHQRRLVTIKSGSEYSWEPIPFTGDKEDGEECTPARGRTHWKGPTNSYTEPFTPGC